MFQELETVKTDRILAKLAKYATQANIDLILGLHKMRPDLHLQVLFALAGIGAQDEMEAILKEHPEDLLAYCYLRDISGAEFECITLFQHALWTTDVRYMAPMMLDCLSHNDKGEQIRVELLRQYNELMEKGVDYQLNGKKYEASRHVNLEPVFKSLHLCNCWPYADLLPAHIRHHYCEQEVSLLDDELDFNKPVLKRSLKIRNWLMNKEELWNEPFRGSVAIIQIKHDWPVFRAALNLISLPALYTMRTTVDMSALKEQLNIPIQTQEEAPKEERSSFTP